MTVGSDERKQRAPEKRLRARDYVCPKCGAKGESIAVASIGDRAPTAFRASCDCEPEWHEEQERHRDRRLVTRSVNLRAANIPRVYIELLEAKRFDIEKVPPVAQDAAGRHHDETFRGFALFGEVGVGKTTSGCYVIERWLKAGVSDCEYHSLPQLVERRDRKSYLDRFAKSRLVMIDDVGYQRNDAGSFVFLLVDLLWRNRVPTIYATSQAEEGILESLGRFESGKAVMDRIRALGQPVILKREESLRGEG